MANEFTHDFDSDADRTPLPAGALSSNGQWIFGSVFAGLLLVGFSFGVWAGVSRTKAPEVAEVKKEEKPAPIVGPPVVKPPVTPPVVTPPVVTPPTEPKPEPNPEPKPEPKTDVKPPVPEPKKEPEKPKVEFKQVAFKEVKPLLTRYCGDCHGSVKPKKGVDISSLAKILKGGTNGEIVKPGAPDKSSLYLTMITTDSDQKMPPEGKPQPTPAEVKMIHDWIASGAKERRRTVRGRRGAVPARRADHDDSPKT